jgi:small subunit ribosomal protein S5
MENQKNVKVEKQVETAKPAAAATATNKKPFNKENRSNAKREFKRPKGGRRNTIGDNFEERVVKTKRISKTTKGGRRMRFSALVIVGDKEGKVGYGIGKATEVPNAIKKAVKNARKSIVRIPMTKKHTVYHEIIGHKGATKVLIKPAPEGTGIIAGGVIRDVLELAGFHDVYTKNLGSNTALNMVMAVVDGLRSQLIPHKVKEARDILPKKEAKASAEPTKEAK